MCMAAMDATLPSAGESLPGPARVGVAAAAVSTRSPSSIVAGSDQRLRALATAAVGVPGGAGEVTLACGVPGDATPDGAVVVGAGAGAGGGVTVDLAVHLRFEGKGGEGGGGGGQGGTVAVHRR